MNYNSYGNEIEHYHEATFYPCLSDYVEWVETLFKA